MRNSYSQTWFQLFLEPANPVQTAREAEFIARHLPLPAYRSVLDLCCGQGRHARLLAQQGYIVTGVDSSAEALTVAQSRSTVSVRYLQLDMRELATLPSSFDAAINLWQSFGYFDEATNTGILRQVWQKLRPSGRFLLDIYHQGFFERFPGTRRFEKGGKTVTEHKELVGNRLTVRLDYGSQAGSDIFDWQLYTPDEIVELAGSLGFNCLVACSDFNEALPPSADKPRMQLLFEKYGAE